MDGRRSAALERSAISPSVGMLQTSAALPLSSMWKTTAWSIVRPSALRSSQATVWAPSAYMSFTASAGAVSARRSQAPRGLVLAPGVASFRGGSVPDDVVGEEIGAGTLEPLAEPLCIRVFGHDVASLFWI